MCAQHGHAENDCSFESLLGGKAVIAETRPVEQTIYSPAEFRSRRFCIALMSLILHRRRRTLRQWARVDLDHAMRNAHAVGDELLGERRWRAAVLQPVLVAVPRAGHAAVDYAPLPDRPVLVGAKVGECPDLRAVAEDCDT